MPCVFCAWWFLRLTNRLDRLAFGCCFCVCMVFFTNDVLFPVSYMPDQLRYIRCAIMYRGEPSGMVYAFGYAVTVSSAKVFAAFRFRPSLVSVRSTSLVNMTLVIWMYLLLHRGGFLTEESRKFFCCIPVSSCIPPSACDIFILLSMMMALYFSVRERQFFLGLACTYPLMFIKPQNFFMILVPFALTALAGESRGRMISRGTICAGFHLHFAMLLGAVPG